MSSYVSRHYAGAIMEHGNGFKDRGRESRLNSVTPPSEPDKRISRIRLLPTPRHGNAVASGYRPESVYLKGTFTPLFSTTNVRL
jgi:hypothetical protein